LGTLFGLPKLLQGVSAFGNITMTHIILIVFIGAIGTAYLYFLAQKLIKTSSPLFASFGTYIQLIFSSLLGFLFFGEHIGV
jgi:drug/metabolite transporter (DMT)-like permease